MTSMFCSREYLSGLKWLTNVKYLEYVNLTIHGHDTHVCTMSEVIGINTEIKMHLPNKEHMHSLMIKNKYCC